MSSSKRILLCPSAYYPSFGGVEEIARNVAAELSNAGFTVAIAVNRWPAETKPFEELWGIPVYRFAMPTPNRSNIMSGGHILASALTFADFVRDWKPDLIHAICPTPASIYLWLAKLRRQFKLLLTFQGELFMDQSGIFQRSAFARFSVQKLVSVSDGITACSRYVLEDAEKRFKFPRVPKRVVFNGVDLEESQGLGPRARPYVLGVGRLVQNKGFTVLIEAFSQIARDKPELDLVLAGDGDCRAQLEAQASQLNLGDRVIFLGKQDRQSVTGLYEGCRFFVLPSPVEPFGIVCLEAMRAGKPVIATNTGGPPEFISDQENGLLVRPNQASELARSMRSLLDDATLHARLGKSAKVAAQKFSWNKIAQEYINLYAELEKSDKTLASSLSHGKQPFTADVW